LYLESGISSATLSPGTALSGFLAVRRPEEELEPVHMLRAEQLWQASVRQATSTTAISSVAFMTKPLSFIVFF